MIKLSFDILVLGGSIAALKCAAILASLPGRRFRIGLATINKRFLFLPLIPDVIAGRVSGDFSSSDISTFCAKRGILYYQFAAKSVDASTCTVAFCNGEEAHYRFLVISTGNPMNNICDQTFWQNFVAETLRKSYSEDLLLDGPSIASYEVATAIASLPRHPQILVRPTSSRPRFSTHPWLGSISHIKDSLLYADSLIANMPRLSCNKAAKHDALNNDTSTRLVVHCQETNSTKIQSIYPIGTHHAFSAGVHGSAQYSSFTAKIAALRIWMMASKLPCSRLVSSLLSEYPFRSRGAMLFSGPDWAGIWLGSHSPVGRPPDIYGSLAAKLRRLFYCTQMRLFYSSAPFSRIGMHAYVFCILLGCLPWLIKSRTFLFRPSRISSPR